MEMMNFSVLFILIGLAVLVGGSILVLIIYLFTSKGKH